MKIKRIIVVLFLQILLCQVLVFSASTKFWSITEEINDGLQQFRALENGLHPDFEISKDKDMLNKVQKLGEKLAKVSMKRKGISYTFFVVKAKQVNFKHNAFSLPGGYIAIEETLLKDLTDEELTAVIAHEMAHSDNGDVLNTINTYNALVEQGKIFKDTKYNNSTMDIEALIKCYKRKQEFAADAYGSLYLYRAGFNPQSAINVIKKLKEFTGGEEYKDEFAGHATFQERIDNLEAYLSKIKSTEDLFSQGVKRIKKKNYNGAIENFTKFLSMFWGAPEAHNNLGYAYFLKAMNALDLGQWYWAEGIDPNFNKEFLVLKGGTKKSVVDIVSLNNAISNYQQALEYYPAYLLCRNNLIIGYWQLEKKEAAEKEIETLAKVAENYAPFYNTLGIIESEKGNENLAEKKFLKSIEIDKNFAPAYYNLANFYYEKGDKKNAKKYLDTFISLKKDDDLWVQSAKDLLNEIK